MSEHSSDPAKLRFFTLQALRLLGVAGVILGLLLIDGRLWPQGATMALGLGYGLLAGGLLGVFVVPAVLIRRWKSPE